MANLQFLGRPTCCSQLYLLLPQVLFLHPLLLNKLILIAPAGQLILVLRLVLGNLGLLLHVLPLLLALNPLLVNLHLLHGRLVLLDLGLLLLLTRLLLHLGQVQRLGGKLGLLEFLENKHATRN